MASFNPRHMLTPTFLAGVLEDRPDHAANRAQYIGQSLLPWRESPERRISWDIIFSENNLAGIYSPRGQAIPGDKMLWSTILATLADVKSSRMLESWSVGLLNDPGLPQVYSSSETGRDIVAKLRAHLADNVAACDDEIDTMYEYFALGALQGEIVWPPKDNSGATITNPMPQWNPNMEVTVSYPIPTEFKQNASTLVGWNSRAGTQKIWTDADANPIKDLEVISELARRSRGVNLRGGRIIMSESILSNLAFHPYFHAWIKGANSEQPGARDFVDLDTIKTFIKTRLGWTIETYDAQWTYREDSPHAGGRPTITRVDFLKEGNILILPARATLGNMLTTKLQRRPGVTSEWVYGKVPWSYENPKPPFDIEVGINATMLPQFPYYDWFVLNVLA